MLVFLLPLLLLLIQTLNWQTFFLHLDPHNDFGDDLLQVDWIESCTINVCNLHQFCSLFFLSPFNFETYYCYFLNDILIVLQNETSINYFKRKTQILNYLSSIIETPINNNPITQWLHFIPTHEKLLNLEPQSPSSNNEQFDLV